jgi:hypothetical protein
MDNRIRRSGLAVALLFGRLRLRAGTGVAGRNRSQRVRRGVAGRHRSRYAPAELFNAFNHAQFAFAGSTLASSIAAPPAGSTTPAIQYVDASQFGRVAARAPRIVQFGLKLIW